MPILPKDCCGCEVCVTLCKNKAIELYKNDEGFYFPRVLEEICINCKMCEMKCPVINAYKMKPIDNIGFFGGYFTDREKLFASASGGFATALGEAFINSGGVVYGTAYSKDAKSIQYQKAENINELLAFRGSKYSQARKKSVYSDVLNDLQGNRKVLFFGLPCEVVALKGYIGQNYQNNLFTCDLICHGVTSERVLAEYVTAIEEKNNKCAISVNMRYKETESLGPRMKVTFTDGTSYVKPLYETEYGRTFQVLKRPSCNKCHFKGQNRYSDMTIGDFHAATPESAVYNKNGVSSVIIHTERGMDLIQGAEFKDFLILDSPKDAVLNNRAYSESIPQMHNRSHFSQVLTCDGLIKAANMKSTLIAEKRRRLKNTFKAYNRVLRNLITSKLGKIIR